MVLDEVRRVTQLPAMNDAARNQDDAVSKPCPVSLGVAASVEDEPEHEASNDAQKWRNEA